MASGERRDTLSQSLKEVYAVAFSPDGKRLVAGGVDNRIRIWQISETAAETTNPLLDSKFAHEGAILNLVFSRDGNTARFFRRRPHGEALGCGQGQGTRLLSKRNRIGSARWHLLPNDKTIVVGRMDGTLGFYDASTGKALPALTAELTRPASKSRAPNMN